MRDKERDTDTCHLQCDIEDHSLSDRIINAKQCIRVRGLFNTTEFRNETRVRVSRNLDLNEQGDTCHL